MTYIDLRVPRADLWKVVLGQMLGWRLHRIDIHPASSGPEAELSFGPFDSEGDGAFVRKVLESRSVTILAERTREAS